MHPFGVRSQSQNQCGFWL